MYRITYNGHEYRVEKWCYGLFGLGTHWKHVYNDLSDWGLTNHRFDTYAEAAKYKEELERNHDRIFGEWKEVYSEQKELK